MQHTSITWAAMCHDCDKELVNKLHKFQHIWHTINTSLGNKALKEMQLKFYKIMAMMLLTYGHEKLCFKYSRWKKHRGSRN